VLVKEQFVFRTNSCTEISSYILISNILSSLNNKLLVSGLVCDLQRAFDHLNHEKLSKMKFFGILGIANKLIKSDLQDMYQSILINSENSYIFLNGSK